ncbi:MAG: tRNA pseudouridine(55) synthase, partial [Candidatus Azotimanducaceae bacterium]
VPLAYAGRLDPMASGKLLVLIGEECKNQKAYHRLDKEYEFEVLLGAQSDTGDVLGLIQTCPQQEQSQHKIQSVAKKLIGDIKLPYPHYSSKTVQGKPLHVWTLEGRLDEIEIPTKQSTIYKLDLLEIKEISSTKVYEHVTQKIETIPKVTEVSKALGNDFRRPQVRESWKAFLDSSANETYQIAKFRCVASSGTYMRTLASIIGEELGTCGLAYSIHRTKIGVYQKLPFGYGFWRKKFS